MSEIIAKLKENFQSIGDYCIFSTQACLSMFKRPPHFHDLTEQRDMRLGVVMLDLIELTAGVEDVWGEPFYKAGLTIHYRDDDLLTILMKSMF